MSAWKAVSWVSMAAVSFGLLTPLIKIGYQNGWMANQMTASQLLMGAIFLWLCIGWREESWRQGTGDRMAIIIGFVGLGFSTVAYNQSIHWHPASIAVVWMFQYVWITVIIEAIWQKKWPDRKQWIAVLLVCMGTILAAEAIRIDDGSIVWWGIESLPWQGAIWGLLSALGYAVFISGSSRLPMNSDPFRNAGLMLIATLPWAVLLFLIDHNGMPFKLDLLESDWIVWMGWGLLLGALGHVFPVIGYQLGSPVLGAGRSALIGALELPVAVIGSMILIGEGVSGWQWIGICLIFAGIIRVNIMNETV